MYHNNMAELMQFHQNSNDPPQFGRPLKTQRRNPEVANLKKRKLFVEVAEDLGFPSPKHKCCEAIVDSEHGLLTVKVVGLEDSYARIRMREGSDVVNAQATSGQDSNNVSGDAQSAVTEVRLDSGFGSANYYDDVSTSWAGSEISQSSSSHVESSARDEKNVEEEEQCLQQDTSWHDDDCLEECISAQYSKDGPKLIGEGLEEFLSSDVVDPKLFPLAAERWGVEQETQPETRKPTIDQEFEQYFSMLML